MSERALLIEAIVELLLLGVVCVALLILARVLR